VPVKSILERGLIACHYLPTSENEAGTKRNGVPEDAYAMDVQRFLIGLGLLILAAGIMWPLLSRVGLGRLPGDIMFQRGGTSFYFPVVTCIIISIVLSALLWLFGR
jgi:Protein of unknown function (DUF2905)